MKQNFKFASYTEAGRRLGEDGKVRQKDNQDSHVLVAETVGEKVCLLAAVCDGIGSLDASSISSKYVCEWLTMFFRAHYKEFPEMDPGDIVNIIHEKVTEANAMLCKKAKSEKLSLGTTLTLLLIVGNTYITVNVGDSRIYLEENGKLRQITKDQTVAQAKYDKGIYSTGQLNVGEDSRTLTQCIGFKDSIVPAYNDDKLSCPARFLLCSDGIYNKNNNKDIKAYITKKENTKKRIQLLAKKREKQARTTTLLAS